jgi:dCMP deaminase
MTDIRPDHHEYFIGIAMAVRRRANCQGNRVGAVVVLDHRVIATGYNGTPENMENCLDGGCHRCANRDKYPSGTGYDLCICVHAEQNALLAAARFGIPVAGAAVYSTMRPCFGCTKEMLQAKIQAVYFIHDWAHPDSDKQAEYNRLQARFPGGIRKLDIDDAYAEWAVSALRSKGKGPVDETGHQA